MLHMYGKLAITPVDNITSCIRLQLPKDTEIMGIHTAPYKGQQYLFLELFYHDMDAELEQRHLHIIPAQTPFENDNYLLLGIGQIEHVYGVFHFALIEVLDTDTDTGTSSAGDINSEQPIESIELDIEDYRELFGSEHIKITRREEE